MAQHLIKLQFHGSEFLIKDSELTTKVSDLLSSNLLTGSASSEGETYWVPTSTYKDSIDKLLSNSLLTLKGVLDLPEGQSIDDLLSAIESPKVGDLYLIKYTEDVIQFAEYLYTSDGTWEQLGVIKPDIDLSAYATKEYADTTSKDAAAKRVYSIALSSNILTLTDENGAVSNVDLSSYLNKSDIAIYDVWLSDTDNQFFVPKNEGTDVFSAIFIPSEVSSCIDLEGSTINIPEDSVVYTITDKLSAPSGTYLLLYSSALLGFPGLQSTVIKLDSILSTIDSVPTAKSKNLVTSGGIHTALEKKQDLLTYDDFPTSGSSNSVTSGGIFNYLGKPHLLKVVSDNPYFKKGLSGGYPEGFLRKGLIPKKVVVIGNSMTIHNYNDTYWRVSDYREMAASTPTSGWVSYLYRHLKVINPDVKVYKCQNVTWERGGGLTIDSTTPSDSTWVPRELNLTVPMYLMTDDGCAAALKDGSTGTPSTDNPQLTLKDVLTDDVDIVISQLYENIPSIDKTASETDNYNEKVRTYFLSRDYELLFSTIRSTSPNAWLYQFGGFWQNINKHHAVIRACALQGVEFCYAPTFNPYHTGISLVHSTTPDAINLVSAYTKHSTCYEVKTGDSIYDNNGSEIYTVQSPVAGHPNDAGFAIIAKTIIFRLYNQVPIASASSSLTYPTFVLTLKSYANGGIIDLDIDLQDYVDTLSYGVKPKSYDYLDLCISSVSTSPFSNYISSVYPYYNHESSAWCTTCNFLCMPGNYPIIGFIPTNVYANIHVDTFSIDLNFCNIYCVQSIVNFNNSTLLTRSTKLQSGYVGFTPWVTMYDYVNASVPAPFRINASNGIYYPLSRFCFSISTPLNLSSTQVKISSLLKASAVEFVHTAYIYNRNTLTKFNEFKLVVDADGVKINAYTYVGTYSIGSGSTLVIDYYPA